MGVVESATLESMHRDKPFGLTLLCFQSIKDLKSTPTNVWTISKKTAERAHTQQKLENKKIFFNLTIIFILLRNKRSV